MRTHAALLLGLSWAVSPVVAGGFSFSAPNLPDYCFYAVYQSLGSYTWEGETTTSSSSSETSGHGSSSGSSRQGSSNSSATTTASSSSSTGAKVTPHGKRSMREKRGHHGSSSTGLCTSTVGVMSAYVSAKSWCTKEQFNMAIPTYWESLCEDASATLISLTEIEANATDEYIASLSLIDPETNSTTTTGTISTPVLLSHSYYKRAYKSYVTHDYALSKDMRMGWGIMGYWGGVLALGMISKAWKMAHAFLRLSTGSDAEKRSGSGRALGPISAAAHFVRTYIIIPASFAPFLSNHQQLFLYHTIPKRLDTLIVFGFWAVAIILSCVDYESFTGNIQTPSLHQQNWQYSSDRTGILSYACLPFLWLFSGRNNIFLWATDFSVQSFNIFHRHTAWVCTLLAVVHSINYSVVFAIYDGRYFSVWKQEYWYMGVVATIIMVFMLVQSATYLRQKSYEIFIIIHFLFSILTIFALFMHTSFDGKTYTPYLWPLVAIWLFDRGLRYVRMVYCNMHVRFGKGFLSTPLSTVTYSSESDLVRVEMYPAAQSLKPAPGQHYYLYQPYTLRGWENHPFTLGCYENPDSKEYETKLIFYIRPYDGWTKRLRNQCQKAGGEIRTKLLLEGPYGHQAPLHTFDNVLFIMGGTGIACAVPYILDHIARVSAGKTNTTRIHLIWTGRQKKIFDEVCCQDLSTALEHTDITTTLFCTDKSAAGGMITSGSTTPTKEKEAAVDAAALQDKASGSIRSVEDLNVDLRYGRPAINSLVRAAAQEAQASSARLAVMTCGPAKMADECRTAMYDVMKGGFRDIEYFEEAFGW
ncbi:ferric reductase family protein [Aspergillus ibericus CBS 121593]|uniref:Ferric reductase transmembrane component 4 n=1 Tax=Aspergillus ibericus CBS 121593 TaxID=1448316 RepID=A0A395GMP3_9EURO|nr:ferric reductase transmembrane component 4 precursor [Aspergillus ibericus CBS 121593]RAK95283.1 ferric reductase transmembrane component 4 precursor [Aspergillus ibericus CBS 121593]